MSKAFVWFLGIVLGLLILTSGGSPLLPVCGHLLFGWVGFLRRVMPNVQVNWSGVGLAVICSLIIVWGVHSLGAWWCAGRSDPTQPTAARRWCWAWTVSLYSLLWLLFLSAMGITGLAHQLGWLFSSGQPWWIVRRNHLYELRLDAMNLHQAAELEQWTLARVRKRFIEEQPAAHRGGRPHPLEAMHVLLFEGPDADLAAAVILHRDEATRKRVGFLLLTRETHGEVKPIEELPVVLARYQPKSGGSTANPR